MERLALELVDSGLIMVSPRGNVSAPSPGLAIVDGNTLEVGHDAARSARLKPRRLHSRFWQSLGTAPLARPFPHHLRAADLAHAHLQSLWALTGGTAEEVLVAAPGLWSEEQLGLLLGIAGACTRGSAFNAVAGRAPCPIGIHEVMDMTLPGLVSQESIRRGGEWLPVPDSREW